MKGEVGVERVKKSWMWWEGEENISRKKAVVFKGGRELKVKVGSAQRWDLVKELEGETLGKNASTRRSIHASTARNPVSDLSFRENIRVHTDFSLQSRI